MKFETNNGICPGGESNKGLAEACVEACLTLDENDRCELTFLNVINCIICTVQNVLTYLSLHLTLKLPLSEYNTMILRYLICFHLKKNNSIIAVNPNI